MGYKTDMGTERADQNEILETDRIKYGIYLVFPDTNINFCYFNSGVIKYSIQ